MDTDKHTVVAHDGVTAGGYPLAKEADLQNFVNYDYLNNYRRLDNLISFGDLDDNLKSQIGYTYDDTAIKNSINSLESNKLSRSEADTLYLSASNNFLTTVTFSDLDTSLQTIINSIPTDINSRVSTIETNYVTTTNLASQLSGYRSISTSITKDDFDSDLASKISMIDNFSTDISDLNEQVTSLSSKVDNTDVGDLSDLRSTVSDIETKINNGTLAYDDTDIKTSISELKSTHESDVSTINGRLDTLESTDNSGGDGSGSYDDTALAARVTANEENISSLQTTVSGLSNYDDTEVKTLINNLNEKVNTMGEGGEVENYDDTALSNRVTQNESDIKELQSSTTELQNGLNSLQDTVDNLNSYEYNDTEVKNDIAEAKSDIAALQTAVGDLTNYDDTDIQASVKTLQDNVSTLTNNDSTMSEEITSLQSTVKELTAYDDSEIKNTLTTLQTTIDTYADDITALKSQATITSEEKTKLLNGVDAITETNQNVTNVNNTVNTLSSTVSTNSSEIEALKTRVTNLETENGNLSATISNLSSQINELYTLVGATPPDNSGSGSGNTDNSGDNSGTGTGSGSESGGSDNNQGGGTSNGGDNTGDNTSGGGSTEGGESGENNGDNQGGGTGTDTPSTGEDGNEDGGSDEKDDTEDEDTTWTDKNGVKRTVAWTSSFSYNGINAITATDLQNAGFPLTDYTEVESDFYDNDMIELWNDGPADAAEGLAYTAAYIPTDEEDDVEAESKFGHASYNVDTGEFTTDDGMTTDSAYLIKIVLFAESAPNETTPSTDGDDSNKTDSSDNSESKGDDNKDNTESGNEGINGEQGGTTDNSGDQSQTPSNGSDSSTDNNEEENNNDDTITEWTDKNGVKRSVAWTGVVSYNGINNISLSDLQAAGLSTDITAETIETYLYDDDMLEAWDIGPANSTAEYTAEYIPTDEDETTTAETNFGHISFSADTSLFSTDDNKTTDSTYSIRFVLFSSSTGVTDTEEKKDENETNTGSEESNNESGSTPSGNEGGEENKSESESNKGTEETETPSSGDDNDKSKEEDEDNDTITEWTDKTGTARSVAWTANVPYNGNISITLSDLQSLGLSTDISSETIESYLYDDDMLEVWDCGPDGVNSDYTISYIPNDEEEDYTVNEYFGHIKYNTDTSEFSTDDNKTTNTMYMLKFVLYSPSET
jgi:hypothetical protein